MKHSAACALLMLTLASPAAWAQMLPRPATLVIKSVPPGAPITLNGSTSTQSTDLSLVVSPGAYTVSVGIQGGKPFCAAKQINLTAGQTVVLVCTESGWGN
jgi:hypothetical protein